VCVLCGWFYLLTAYVTQTHCTEVRPHPDPAITTHSLYRKDVAKVWTAYPEFSDANTLIVDDCSYKMAENPPRCVLYATPWTMPEGTEDTCDNLLLRIFNRLH